MGDTDITIEPEEPYEVCWAMRHYGGSFVKALGVLVGLADQANTKRLKNAFRDYWDKYHKLGKEEHELLKKHAGKYRCLDCGAFFSRADVPDCPKCNSDNWQEVDGSLPKVRED